MAIYVNKSIEMAHIKFVGFDMDATLAIYKTPQADKLAFETAKKRLVEVGYPPEIGSLSYDDKLVTRGVWFDKKLGNFLKMDEENGVLAAWHGTRRLNDHQIRVSYPNKHIQLEDSRIYIMNTVFNVSKTHLIASIISFMEENEKFTDMPNGEGFISHGRSITYHRIFADCHDAFDWVYTASNYRNILVENISHFIEYTPECGRLLKTLSNGGERQVFLLTNSDYFYANHLMSYILGTSWRSYFDFVFVNGDKPRWFAEDIKFKEIDTQTGVIHLGNHEGELRKEKVYSGGSAAEFRRTTGMTGKDTLYVGDHIYGDVHKSKKISGIRTLLIIPELDVEEQIWKSEIGRVYQLAQLQEKMYTSSDAQYIHPDTFAPVRNEARVMFKEITDSMELKYGTMGSLMRHGIHQTHFAYAARKYADIYTSNVYNLLRYNLNTWHFFVPSLTLLPHERNSFENIENNNSTENLLANGNGNGVELEHINTKESDSLIQQV